MLRILPALRSSAAVMTRPVPCAVNEWLKAPSISELPKPANLSPLEISRVLSVVSSRSLGQVTRDFLADCLDSVAASLSRPGVEQNDVISSLHILDRIAANCMVHERTGEVIDTLLRCGALKVGKTDAFIGARAGLLLGYPELARVLISPSQSKSLSVQNLIHLATLSASTSEVTLRTTIHRELVKRLESSEQLHLLSSFELVSAMKAVAVVGVGLDSVTTGTTRTMKKAGSELVRRIELRTVSPHSIVDLIECFSGQPPCPIHPLLLQACYAFLLEDRNLEQLSSDEISRILHASSLADIENVVLTRALVNQLDVTQSDPRIGLRAISGISLSRAFLQSPSIRAASCINSLSGLQSPDDLSMLTTAVANLVGSGSICHKTVDFLLETSQNMNIVDAANLLLIASVPLPRTPCVVPASIISSPIPNSALEITEKANPAMPRSDVKKKRLAKRSILRADSLQEDFENETIETKICECQIEIASRSNVVVGELIGKCLAVIRKGPDPSVEWKETARACSDIIVALHFLDSWIRSKASKDELKMVSEVMDECFAILAEADEPVLAFEEGIHDVESSVVRSLKNLGLGCVSSPMVTNSNLRVAVQLSP